MRKRIPNHAKHRARGVSLPPATEKAALEKAKELDISFSKYVQRLIRADVETPVLTP